MAAEEVAADDAGELTGTVVEGLPNDLYRVALKDGTTVLAHVAREMRLAFTRLRPGDEVRVELSTYDPNRARITRRCR